jgi:hypothetical protein
LQHGCGGAVAFFEGGYAGSMLGGCLRRFFSSLAKGSPRFLCGCDLLFEFDALQFQSLDLRLPGAKDAFLFRTFSR